MQIRDTRRSRFLTIDNEIFLLLPEIGVYGLAVYNVLCWRANQKSQECFIKQEKIADILGVSRKTVGEAVLNLEWLRVLKRVRQHKDNGHRATDRIVLLDKSEWVLSNPDTHRLSNPDTHRLCNPDTQQDKTILKQQNDFKKKKEVFDEILNYFSSKGLGFDVSKELKDIYNNAGINNLEEINRSFCSLFDELKDTDSIGLVVYKIRQGVFFAPKKEIKTDEYEQLWIT